MSLPSAYFDPERSLSAFLTFLRHAAAEKRDSLPETQNTWLEAAALLHPLDEGALDALTIALQQQQRHDHAVALAAIIAQLQHDRAAAHFRHGYALQLSKRHADAIEPYRKALALEPQFPQLRNNLAGALSLVNGSLDERIALLESALADNPGEHNAWINLTQAYRATLNLPLALEAGAQAVKCAPHSPMAHNNYALTLREAQRWDDALRVASTASALAPDDPTMQSNLAMLLLMHGDYARGWPAHEARWNGSMELGGNRPVMSAPGWRGESLAGKTLLVWGEQGLGDVLQFSRYIPLLAERVHREGGRLAWNSFPQMGALLVRSLGAAVDSYTAGGRIEALPPFDYEIPLLSLPLLFGTREETIPARGPYLHADTLARHCWRQRLAGESRLKVGLTWTGSAGHQRNPFRRVGWERYATHFGDMRDIAFYCLQPGAASDVAAAQAAGFPMTDYTAGFASIDDTAAFVSALDLVITVCTSVSHLSGALGQRTWVLLDVNPHWVWLLDRRDSPWYPSATLYRQPQFGEWDPALAAVARDLRVLAASHRAA
ncbi:MAG TPA: tetratricopeptide repeat-containing glycosyltransferase family protein [Paraburkholderia sp.]|nr:tetratricopeptide repeat-containing glycosyltransferase family protein [Paraburkholderia sp.]